MIVYFDCCGLNRNESVALAMPQLLVDLELCRVAIVCYLQRNHSKSMCDQKFGHMEGGLKTGARFSQEATLMAIEEITTNRETGQKMQCTLVNPDSYTDVKRILRHLYNLDCPSLRRRLLAPGVRTPTSTSTSTSTSRT